MSSQYPSFDEIKAVEHKLSEMRSQYYFYHDLFSAQWWLLLLLAIAPWIVWWKIVDKSRIKEILLYGVVLSTIVVLLDDIGGELGLWSYPYQVLRLIPRLNAIDFSVLPVIHMLAYQYFKSWKAFLVGNVIMALLFSFIAEPIFVWINIYEMDNWRYIYSFPIYIIKALFVRWLIEYTYKKSNLKNK
ncbi:hypothetical protein P5G65_22685 [Paenibacillus chondroitinus]|uniref:Uncharacterized protein n=1 Tax=Paenibacillus chondroitinus TaxID=59842 RepID=A0ABU6DG25_9BACL|nr:MULTISPECIES: CBO0543 family protein [Paenibacillus]MCY9662655.1 hypothetical protein [Paenibacillus anseongense]MEB4796720.1 hypothetical protein [Paenibacillus chondroitinus]